MFTKPALGKGSTGPRRRSAQGLSWGRALALALLCLLGCCALSGPVRGAGSSEYQVKAAFLYNFMKFVDWPADGFSAPGSFTMGIIGKDPFGEGLEEIRGKSVKGRRIAVLHLKGIEELRQCDMVFICTSERGRLSQILREAQNRRILTVADQDGFCQAGGMMNLVFMKNRVAFEVNTGALNRARLRVSSQLLKLARLVPE